MGHTTKPPPSDMLWPELDDLVGRLVRTRAQVAAAQAAEARVLAESAELITARIAQRRDEAGRKRRLVSDRDLPLREVALELGMAMRVSDRTVQGRIGDSFTLVTKFRATLARWESGDIDAGHVWAIVHAGVSIGRAKKRRRYEKLALAAAATESPARLGPIAKAIAASIDPETFEELLGCAHGERRVPVYALEAGLARLVADLPAPLAYAIADRLTEMARHLIATEAGLADDDAADEAGESGMDEQRGDAESAQTAVVTGIGATRTMDQVRADVLCDLPLAAAPTAHGDAIGAIRGSIQITVPALTLAGAGGDPALLAGYGPIGVELARRLAVAAPGWDRVFVDPGTGEPLEVDRYRPSNALRRHLAARDERCRTPGCTRPVHRCDVDHTEDHAGGGRTCVGNLAHCCRRHHVCKHHTAWRVRQVGRGTLEWTGPSGRRYLDKPPALVRFVPSDPLPMEEPAPF
ncbi:DUF222 domain-containing protein [Microbacterium fluvii]|uniref:DUF222 domain-containing protein n=1 Tax=Microbacterium fluvii TaxID=415215 RepID=A0ABW2HJC4_9MICO|nr:HNH endonuclease signature motif containing protein [Microbacterium fluvii]MCU4673392.1 HNH endonuclease [Microbacterium fluvii]